MIRKKRMSKGIAKILSGLLVFGMVAGLVPTVPGGTVHAKAADVSEPGVNVYATKEQLMTAFTPDENGTNANVGKLLFGKNASGTAQGWYILGKDNGVQGDNTIIFAASPIATGINYSENPDKEKNYQNGIVYSNHYGASNLRKVLQGMVDDTNYFSDAEKALMQETEIKTWDSKNDTTYTNSDKLYALNSNYSDNKYVLAGSVDQIKISIKQYCSNVKSMWLRTPFRTSYCHVNVAEESRSYTGFAGIIVNDTNQEVRPAANLDLSNVLFASVATCNDGTINIGEAMTLRLDGKNKGIGTVTYNASTKKIKVDRGNTTDRVYLMVQCKLGGQESLDGCTIDKSQDVTMFSDDVDLSKCKIWLETTDADGMIYAVEATEENGGTPAEEHTGIHSIDLPSGETWQGVDSLDKISDAGYYYLTDNVSLTESWTPQNNVVLCLNGKTITMNADNKAVIEVDSNNSFTLCDCKNGGIITHGTKSDGTNKYSGSGVNVNGTFTMYGGSISGNTADQGGGVYNSGTFNMNGGTISENTSNVTGSTLYGGGGVYNAYGTFNMNGGIISKNSVRDCGGGVANYQGTFHMFGGEIKENVSGNYGGGVYQSGDLTLSGAVVIAENKAKNENNNLYIPAQTTVSANGLTSGAKIGVTTESNPDNDDSIIFTNDSASAEYFISDNSKYETANASGQVVLKLKAETTTEAPMITTQPQSVSVKAGEMATFTVVAAGTDLSYQWRVNKNDNAGFADIVGANSESYTLNAVSKDCNGYQYQCVVSNTGNSVTSDTVTLTVTEDTKPISYNLWIGGTQVTSQNTSGTGWKYDAGTNTLTLTDYKYNGEVYKHNGTELSYYRAVIWCNDNLNIKLAGENTIVSKTNDGSPNGYRDGAICINGDLVISGAGKLNVKSKPGYDVHGIYARKKLVIEGATIVAEAADNDNVAFTATGIYAGEGMTVRSANVTAKAGKSASYWGDSYTSYGIESGGSITFSQDAVIYAEGKTAALNKKPEGYTGTIGLVFQQNNTTIPPTPEPTPNPEPNPEPKPEPTPTPNPNPTPDPAPATSTPATSTPAALTTAAPAASAPAQVTYDILDGAGSSWTQNTDGSLAIRGSGEISKFREVKVDGVTVDPVNYTVTEGSTIITFKPEYLKSLSAGNHSFELVWTDGTAATNFTVAENADQSVKSPKTGEDFSMALCTALLMVSCAGLAGIFVRRKKSCLR